jgi:hypothetical protein
VTPAFFINGFHLFLFVFQLHIIDGTVELRQGTLKGTLSCKLFMAFYGPDLIGLGQERSRRLFFNFSEAPPVFNCWARLLRKELQ